jgi:metal-sulfur cluster biosynthetic enzyme
MPAAEDSRLKLEVEAALQQVLDPEIGRSVVDIGLIYRIEDRSGVIHVDMTTTSRGCPAAGFLVDAVRDRIISANLGNAVEVELTYDPPWTPDMMRA